MTQVGLDLHQLAGTQVVHNVPETNAKSAFLVAITCSSKTKNVRTAKTIKLTAYLLNRFEVQFNWSRALELVLRTKLGYINLITPSFVLFDEN